MKLSREEKRLLFRINEYIENNGKSPSIREMVRMIELTTYDRLKKYLDGLIESNVISYTPMKWRSVRIINHKIIPMGINKLLENIF